MIAIGSHAGIPWRTGTAAFALIALLSVAPAALANLCDGVPECQLQDKGPIKVKFLHTTGWAFYCSGDYPFYWNWEKHASCCTAIENPFEESGHPGKLDVTITHSVPFTSDDFRVTMACSRVNQNGPANCQTGTPRSDPHCPTVSGTEQNYCSKGPVPVCIQVWEERCTDGTLYYCTADEGAVWCIRCSD